MYEQAPGEVDRRDVEHVNRTAGGPAGVVVPLSLDTLSADKAVSHRGPTEADDREYRQQ